MRLVGLEVIEEAQRTHASAKGCLSAWKSEVQSPNTKWSSFNDLRGRYPSADKVGDRYVFDIGGTKFRLVTRINFAVGIVELRWFGTHAEYDKINVEEV